MANECDGCAMVGRHGVPAVGHANNPEWSGYDLCQECLDEMDTRPPVDAAERDPNRANVVADDGAALHIANALAIWEAGDFSEWAEQHGFPLTIGDQTFANWGGVEDALSNFPTGPFDPRELAD